MSFFFWNVALALIWALLTGEFSLLNLLVGFVLGYLLMAAARRAFAPTSYFRKVNQVGRFVFFFLHELIVANLQVARVVLRRKLAIRPGIVALPLDARSDVEITLVSNLLSLTPGTLSLEVSHHGKMLLIHSLDVADEGELVRKIKTGLEARTLEVTR